MNGAAQVLSTPTLPLTTRPVTTRRGLCHSLPNLVADGICKDRTSRSCGVKLTRGGRAMLPVLSRSAHALSGATQTSGRASTVAHQPRNDTTKTPIRATTNRTIWHSSAGAVTWPQMADLRRLCRTRYRCAAFNRTSHARIADDSASHCAGAAAIRAISTSAVGGQSALTSTMGGARSTSSQRCHLAWDQEHHQRNAANTRRLKQARAGQMELVS